MIIKKTAIAISVASLASLIAGCNFDSVKGVEQKQTVQVVQKEVTSDKNDLKEKDNALAKVNGEYILSSPDITNLDNVIMMEIVAQKAKKGGLNQDALDDIKAQIENIERQAIFEAYASDFIESVTIDESEVKERYESLKENANLDEYQFKFAKFDQKEQADEAIKSINEGDRVVGDSFNFFKNAQTGEDMVWTSTDELPPMFSSVLPSLDKGMAVEEPLASNQGYFVIYLMDERKQEMPSLDDLKGDIEMVLKREKLSEEVRSLRSDSTIQIK